MGFTNRMGEILASANVLIHSSVGLTVLEAIIRGCPVISYGFGYGHVRVSNHALERFGLAQVARSPVELGPAIERALAQRLEPDPTFAERPSTAAMILGSTRRVQPLPAWRVRALRAAVTTAAAAAGVIFATFLSSVAYGLVSSLGVGERRHGGSHAPAGRRRDGRCERQAGTGAGEAAQRHGHARHVRAHERVGGLS